MKLSVSILGIKDDIEKIKEIEKSRADYIHLDIMDGEFVSNKVDMFNDYNKTLDIHLMVNNVKEYIDKYKLLNPEYITIHYEVIDNPKEIIDYIHNLGIKAGISINPSTPIESIFPYLKDIDLVLVMSVVPGKGGQTYIESSTDKINKLYELKPQYNYQIEVDGGINNETIKYVKNADIVVVGSYITKSDNYELKINEMLLYK